MYINTILKEILNISMHFTGKTTSHCNLSITNIFFLHIYLSRSLRFPSRYFFGVFSNVEIKFSNTFWDYYDVMAFLRMPKSRKTLYANYNNNNNILSGEIHITGGSSTRGPFPKITSHGAPRR